MGSRRQVGGLPLDRHRNNSSGTTIKKPEWVNVGTGMWLDVVTEL